MEVIDRLEVKIISGEGFPVIDNQSPTAFVEVLVGPDSRKTKPVPETSHPVWNSPTMIFDQILAHGTDAVLLRVKHVDLFTGKDVLIGQIAISLATALNSPGVDIEDSYPITVAPGSTVRPTGTIRLAVTYFNTADDDIAAGATMAPEQANAPNLLQIRVLNGDFSSTSAVRGPVEAFVIIQVGDLRKQTQVSKKDTNPTWDDLIELPLTDGNGIIEVTVKQLLLLRSAFIGRVRIPMNEVAGAGEAGLKRDYGLLNENFEFLERGNGHISLSMKWIFDQATDDDMKKRQAQKKSMFSALSTRLFRRKSNVAALTAEEIAEKEVTSPLIEEEEEDEDENELTANMSPQELEAYYDEKRRKRTEQLEKLLEKADFDEAEIKEGDYIIQVHIIEVLDIVAKDSDGLSDPYCVIEVFGQKQKTRVIRKTKSCFFDETFYFNFKNVKREQIQEGTLTVTCYDKDWFSSDLVGHYQVDLQTIYNKPDHEMYRQVVALRDPSTRDKSESQGILKLSVCVLGPGDAQKVHDPLREEDEDEKDLELNEGIAQPDPGDGITQTQQFLVLSIVRVEGLPGYDRIISSMKNGLYAYIKLEFGNLKALKTSKVSVSGKKNLTIQFDEELWFPVWIPSTCRKAKLSIYNKEFGRRDLLIATAYVDMDEVTKLDRDPVVSTMLGLGKKKYQGPAFRWTHLYGANPLVRGSTQAASFMNRFPSFGSAYRGRMLMGARLLKQSDGNNLPHIIPMVYDIPDALLPKDSLYLFRVMIYQGSDFGNKGPQARGKEGSYALGISIGSLEVRSAFRTYVNGFVDWIQVIEKLSVPLPDLQQMPDTILTVYRGSESSYQSVAYTRLNTLEFLPKLLQSDAMWYELKHDQSHKSVSTLGYPGAVLLKMALVNMEDVENPPDWEVERKKLENKKPYCLRVLIYQARSLPSTDDDGKIDPYVKVRFAGQKKKTQTRNNTQNPTYYEVLTFVTMLPQDLTLAPNILLQVWDSNALGNAPIAALRHAVKDVTVQKSFLAPADPPQWRELYGIDGKGSLGEVLVAFHLVEMKAIDQNVPRAEDITPILRKVFIDIHIFGIRDLKKKGKAKNIKKPFLQFDIASQSYGESFQFSGSNKPTPYNPNYLERHTAQISLPEDPLFTPTLEVKVLDERLAGSVLLGVTNIPLNSKLPWNGDEYIPPRQHMILQDNLANQKTLAKKREKKKLDALKLVKPQQGSVSAEEIEEAEKDPDPQSAIRVKDSGLGLFPPDEIHREANAKYGELPKIMDDQEMKLIKEAKEKKLAMRKKKKSEGKGLFEFDLEFGSNDDWKRYIQFPTQWNSNDFLVGREWWTNSTKPGEGGNLENYLETYPFENYEIFSGHVAFNKFGKRKDTKQKVGLLKAVIRICVRNPLLDDEYKKFAQAIKTVNTCVIRVYVIKAMNLQPTSYFSKAADPYIKISLGDQEEKDLKNKQSKTLNPEFYSYFEFKTQIPGPTSLKLQVFDHYKYFGSDALMGETIIDCEDRFFHPKWTAIGDKKPLEGRNLTKIGSATTQGLVVMWLDIFTEAEARDIPPIPISGPEKLEFEIRVILWRSKNVTGPRRGMKDLYGQFYMEGENQTRHRTDVHWRCKGGTASWNWRIKIPITLPIRSRELGRLYVKLFDRNIITSDEIIGENMINLYDWLVLAYHRKDTVAPFKEKREAKEKLQYGVPFPVEGQKDVNIAEGGDEEEEEDDDDEIADDLQFDELYEDNADAPLLSKSDHTGLTNRKPGDKGSSTGAAAAGKIDVVKGDGLGSNGAMTDSKKQKVDAPLSDEAKEENDPSETKKLIDQINVFLGIGDSVAEDAEWIEMTFNDKAADIVRKRGALAVSVTIVPKSEAESRPVGIGRDEPNVNPYLPPPVGRWSFSFNPFYLISGLCGTEVLMCCLCILCCICAFGIFYFISAYLSGIEAIVDLF